MGRDETIEIADVLVGTYSAPPPPHMAAAFAPTSSIGQSPLIG